nr:MAG TPA: hypothetical protein [Caudoviricetes sp.]
MEERWIGVVPFDLNARGFPEKTKKARKLLKLY